MIGTASPKPMKGAALIARRLKRADSVRHERREMQAALRLDERTCRVPRCCYRPMKLPIDSCHLKHRGMGGNPSGDRTDRHSVIALCRVHHGFYDAGQLDIEPLTSAGTRGICAYYEIDAAWLRQHIATEQVIGVSVERNPSR